MLKRNDIVFIDTNAIAAAHSAKAWGAVRGAFRLLTALLCVEEATRVNRHGARLVDKTMDQLSAELTVEEVDDGMRFALVEKLQGVVALDPGERDLLALALRRGREIWCFCGPDKAALRALHQLGWSDRMVSLERNDAAVGSRDQGAAAAEHEEVVGAETHTAEAGRFAHLALPISKTTKTTATTVSPAGRSRHAVPDAREHVHFQF